ncbi:MAG: CHAT domain-containing protein [Candidatus Eremiobacteraeota bacterium]|nr:CHAT domain-containing protein [Candidatus Eremiobacteraeota bacterium]
MRALWLALLLLLMSGAAGADTFSQQLEKALRAGQLSEVHRLVGLQLPESEGVFRDQLSIVLAQPKDFEHLEMANILARTLLSYGRPRATRVLTGIQLLAPPERWQGTILAHLEQPAPPTPFARPMPKVIVEPPPVAYERLAQRADELVTLPESKALSLLDSARHADQARLPAGAGPRLVARMAVDDAFEVKLRRLAAAGADRNIDVARVRPNLSVDKLLDEGKAADAWLALEPELPSFSALQSAIPPKTMVVRYLSRPEAVYLLTASPDGASIHRSSYRAKEWREALSDFRQGLLKENDIDKPSAQLYDWLLGPVQGELGGLTTLVLIPDEPLTDMPFEGLHGHPGYLIEQVEVVMMTSVEPLLEHPDRSDPAGFQDYSRAQLDRPRLASLRGAAHLDTPVEVGAGGTGSLALAGERLSLRELGSMRLGRAWLVSLSAVDSPERAVWPELFEAFHRAGVSTLVVNRWPIGRDLVNRFHALLSHGIRPGHAMRQVKLEMLQQKKTSHPHQWAGLTLIGDWR